MYGKGKIIDLIGEDYFIEFNNKNKVKKRISKNEIDKVYNNSMFIKGISVK